MKFLLLALAARGPCRQRPALQSFLIGFWMDFFSGFLTGIWLCRQWPALLIGFSHLLDGLFPKAEALPHRHLLDCQFPKQPAKRVSHDLLDEGPFSSMAITLPTTRLPSHVPCVPASTRSAIHPRCQTNRLPWSAHRASGLARMGFLMAVDKQTNRRTQTQQHGKNDNNDDDWLSCCRLLSYCVLPTCYLPPPPAASPAGYLAADCSRTVCCLPANCRLLLLLLLLAILPPTALQLCVACPQCFLPLQMPVLSLDDRPWSPNLPPAAGVYLSLPFCLCLCFC